MADIPAIPGVQSATAMQVEVTTRCNFGCFYCAGRDMPQRDMDYDMFCQILDRHVAAYGVPPAVSLQGEGEPTINRDFFRMAARVKEIGSRPYTITNGTYKYWDKFLSSFDSIGVSVDTMNEEEADKIGRYNLPRVLEFIETMAVHMPVVVYSVKLSAGAEAVGAWCRERGIRQIVQPLQSKPDYQYRYTQIVRLQPHREKFSCVYLRKDPMRYYNLNGTEMPCPFIKNTDLYPGLTEMKHMQHVRQCPACCTGCAMADSPKLGNR
jgi:MoaA/NifB/PqqE/SkfB family radical SAM enzyme